MKRDTASISRIKPTDVPFASMTDAEIDRLVAVDALHALDPAFRESASFRSVIAKDTRLVEFQDGDIIVREGDWGNSAFFVVSGSVLVDVGRLTIDHLGRREVKRKGLVSAIAQLWSNCRSGEFRDTANYHGQDEEQRRIGGGSNLFLQDIPGVFDTDAPVEIQVGQLFGELAALGRTKRTATVIAKGSVQLLEVRWQGLRTLMRKDSEFRAMIDDVFRRDTLAGFLQRSPLFEQLADNEEAMAELVSSVQLRTYGEYDKIGSYKELARTRTTSNLDDEPLIAAEGDHPNNIIFIRNGLARVSRRQHHGHLTESYLGPGQVFGLYETAQGRLPLQSSLHAIGFVSTIEIPTTQDFREPVGALFMYAMMEQHLLEHRAATSTPPRKKQTISPLSGVARMDTRRVPQDFVEFLVGHRFVNGTETMLIDMDRCTRCDDCVRACATAHDNNPRFVRQGPINNNIMVANACMHCQDPVCMIECPTGAISRREADGVVVINDTTCIGCSTCANNCPYDAIRMVEIRDADGSFIRDHRTRAPIPKATKCDLCVDQLGGPACQHACPHDALIRIDMRNVEELVDWQDR
ncbi:MAG: 4Fe-4S dicluster domain-containing protein [Pirellulales bacterium]